ncbi:MAG: DUF2304 domain-containing protein [Patescibacteria group bacterium]|jgi:hypothetical protein
MLIQILLVLGFILALWITLKRFRQRVISLSEFLAWSVLWLGGAIVSILPKLTEYLAAIFGVGRGVDLILYAAVAIQFFLIFKLFINLEKTERQLTKIVEQNALAVLSFPRSSSDDVGNPESDGSSGLRRTAPKDDKNGDGSSHSQG